MNPRSLLTWIRGAPEHTDLSRRQFLKFGAAAAGGIMLADDLLHLGRAILLPAAAPPNGVIVRYRGIHWLETFPFEEVVKRALARHCAQIVDQVAIRTFNFPTSAVSFDNLPARIVTVHQPHWDVFNDRELRGSA